jgi:hypothetical protein
MCEDFMQLTISPNTNSGINSEINTSNQTDIADIRTIPFSENQQFTIYAIKNNNVEQLHKQNNQTGENQSPLNFSFLINKYTLEHLDEAKKHIEKFLHANKMRSSYSNIYKKIVQQKSFEEFYNAITSSPIETDLLHNDPFLLTCLYYYQNPAYLLGNMLCNKMINPRWKNGAEFSEFFLQHFSKATKELMATLTNTYDKHMLYKSLNKNLIDHKLKHKCCKI